MSTATKVRATATSARLVGGTGVGHIVVVDVGLVISIDTFVVTWAFVGTVGVDCIRGVTGHGHV
jgi:hypothetical protein